MRCHRLQHLRRFYEILNRLEISCGGCRLLSNCSSSSRWPQRGLYFFFEKGEVRSVSGSGNRVVRVGTHGVSLGSRTSLWNRLAQHRGTTNLGGNHRGSVFRLLVGSAIAARDHTIVETWGRGQSAPRSVRDAEHPLEHAVSLHIGAMPCLWVSIDDAASAQSRRAYIERNSIALLSNASTPTEPLDQPSGSWLGLWCPHDDVRSSALWNSRHTSATYDPAFLDELDHYVSRAE